MKSHKVTPRYKVVKVSFTVKELMSRLDLCAKSTRLYMENIGVQGRKINNRLHYFVSDILTHCPELIQSFLEADAYKSMTEQQENDE